MPSRNSIKQYEENGTYHIYNRGIDKRDIFVDDKDYKYFLYLLKIYLEDIAYLEETSPQERLSRRSEKSFHNKIDLLGYCLMPNHFHLLIKQKKAKDISNFMKCLMTSYSMYFNLKYKRTGTLFQGRYKAILIKQDDYLLHLSRYIHLNPLKLLQGQSLQRLASYDYSSYVDYLGKRNTRWVNPKTILDYFEVNKKEGMISKDTYQKFVEEYVFDSAEILGNMILE